MCDSHVSTVYSDARLSHFSTLYEVVLKPLSLNKVNCIVRAHHQLVRVFPSSHVDENGQYSQPAFSDCKNFNCLRTCRGQRSPIIRFDRGKMLGDVASFLNRRGRDDLIVS